MIFAKLMTAKFFWIATIVVIVAAVGTTLGIIYSGNDEDDVNVIADEFVFPETFMFGSASAAYQVEGASDVDGKGRNIWDDLTQYHPFEIADQSTGDDGPDSYYHYKEDVRIMKDIGLQFYRFSISWARVIPDGDIWQINEPGLQYYDNLIDELIANDIVPMVTMYHWDLPSKLQELGGHVHPLFVDYFEQYANLLYARYGDRVKYWITFNEPSVFCPNGYSAGSWAPRVSVPGIGEYLCSHYVILAHARAYHLYQNNYYETQKGKVGITLSSGYAFPKDPTKEDDLLASEISMQFGLGWYAHAIYTSTGGYPQIMIDRLNELSNKEGRAWSRLPTMDVDTISYCKGTSDFLGLNYYTSSIVEINPNPDEYPMWYLDPQLNSEVNSSWPRAKSVWLYSIPEGLREVLKWIKNSYNNPEVFITENGWSDDGQLEDDDRIEYLRLHLYQVLLAIKEDGCNVAGHTTWSILDNFEWLMGFTEKFGIHSFDPVTKERTPKKSTEFLKKLIETRELPEKQPAPSFP